MSAIQSPALAVVVHQLAATLDAYEHDAAALARCPGDMDLYGRVSQQVDRMRMYAAELPSVSRAWVELLIRHFELAHSIWRLQQGGGGSTLECHTRVSAAVAGLREQCVRLLRPT